MRRVQSRSDYSITRMNSIIIAVGSTLLALLIAIPAAYSMAFPPTQRTRGTLLWMLSTKMMPPVGVLVPIYLLFRTLRPARHAHRPGHRSYASVNLPIVVWMLFTYFKEMPKRHPRSGAHGRGATVGASSFYVLPPMALPGIASTLLLNVILAWNEAFWTLNLTTSERRAAHRVHRLFFQPRRTVLGQAVRRLDAGHRADPGARLVQPAAARARPDLRRRQIEGAHEHAWDASHSKTCASPSDPIEIIKGVDLEIADGEFVVFVGPSGCGKSTLLRMIAGLEDITGGRILIDGNDVVDVPPANRGLVDGVPVLRAVSAHERARQHRLRPEDGRAAARPKSTARSRPRPRILQPRRPISTASRASSPAASASVSRSAGRSCAQPKAFLFDEPLSNLDAALRVQMRMEVDALHQALGDDHDLCHARSDRGHDAWPTRSWC